MKRAVRNRTGFNGGGWVRQWPRRGTCRHTPHRAAALGRGATRRWRELGDGISIFRETRLTRRAIRKDVGLSGVCSIEDLIKLVSARRGRPITVREIPLPVSAACGSSADSDSIVVDSRASELSRLHAILHELGHILYDAPRSACRPANEAHEPMEQDLARQLFPGLKPAEVVSFFKRSRYKSKAERRVEIFATVMLANHLLLRENAGFDSSTLTHRRAGV